jgi:hypothetical protein
MAICPHCGQKMPKARLPAWAKDYERLGEVRKRTAQMLREDDPLEGLPAQAKKALGGVGADAPEKIARALQYKLVTRQTKGVGDRTYAKIEKWLFTRGIMRVSEDENFFYRGTKKLLT